MDKELYNVVAEPGMQRWARVPSSGGRSQRMEFLDAIFGPIQPQCVRYRYINPKNHVNSTVIIIIDIIVDISYKDSLGINLEKNNKKKHTMCRKK